MCYSIFFSFLSLQIQCFFLQPIKSLTGKDADSLASKYCLRFTIHFLTPYRYDKLIMLLLLACYTHQWYLAIAHFHTKLTTVFLSLYGFLFLFILCFHINRHQQAFQLVFLLINFVFSCFKKNPCLSSSTSFSSYFHCFPSQSCSCNRLQPTASSQQQQQQAPKFIPGYKQLVEAGYQARY